MKIAVSATGRALDGDVDPRFGRCDGFVVFDRDPVQAGPGKGGGRGMGGGRGRG